MTTTLDGSEDVVIHCLKPNGQIPNGQQVFITSEFEQNLQIDPERDEENGYQPISVYLSR